MVIQEFLNALQTYELSDVSIGKFIDTLSLSHSLLVGETVNCCQHVQDLKAIGNSRYGNSTHKVNQGSDSQIVYCTFTPIVSKSIFNCMNGLRVYRFGTVNLNTVNSKFYLIQSFFEIFARFLSVHI